MARNVLEMGLKELRTLTCGDFPGRMTPAEFRHIFEVCGALWLHLRNPKAPHAELTSGKCSNGFVDVLRVLRYTNLCEIMADQTVKKCLHLCDAGKFDWVIGSDHAGATFSYAVAKNLGAQHDFTEKGEGKSQKWKRFEIQPGEIVLQVEELVTTTGTLEEVRKGIREGNPHKVQFAPFVLVLVHRSKADTFENTPIVSFIHYDIEVWEPENCPLCKAGSERIKPKQNWARLTARI